MREKILSWTSEETPKGQPRPRAVSFGGNIRIYNPNTAKDYKKSIGQNMIDEAIKQGLELPIHGSFFIETSIEFARPKRLERKKDPDEAIPHTSKPDIDNVLKVIMDSIQQHGGVTDDSGIAGVHATKWYCPKGEKAKTTITLYREQGRCDAKEKRLK